MALHRKIELINRALAVNPVDNTDGIDVLAKLGGYEIGGLAAPILGAAAHRRPVVIDGFISGAAASIAGPSRPRRSATWWRRTTRSRSAHRSPWSTSAGPAHRPQPAAGRGHRRGLGI